MRARSVCWASACWWRTCHGPGSPSQSAPHSVRRKQNGSLFTPHSAWLGGKRVLNMIRRQATATAGPQMVYIIYAISSRSDTGPQTEQQAVPGLIVLKPAAFQLDGIQVHKMSNDESLSFSCALLPRSQTSSHCSRLESTWQENALPSREDPCRVALSPCCHTSLLGGYGRDPSCLWPVKFLPYMNRESCYLQHTHATNMLTPSLQCPQAWHTPYEISATSSHLPTTCKSKTRSFIKTSSSEMEF